MSKVKIIERNVVEKEIDMEYPIYLHFQDEDCFDELVMVNENSKITIKYGYFGISIITTSLNSVEEYHLKSLTTKEHFEEAYNEAIKYLNEIIFK